MNIKEYIKQFNKSFEDIITEFEDDYNSRKEIGKEWMAFLENKTHLVKNKNSQLEIVDVIRKLKNPDYQFSQSDSSILKTFTGQINRIVGISNRINNFKEGTALDNGKSLILFELFNSIKKTDKVTNLNISLNSNLNKFIPHLFSVIKHSQNPEQYPVYYKYWKNILGEVLGLETDYDSFSNFYRNFPLEDRHANFASYLGVIGFEIANNINKSGLNIEKGSKDYNYLIKKVITEKDLILILDGKIKSNSNDMTVNEPYSGIEKDKPSNIDVPLNQILYGPPGTGKTYHTVNKALEIIGVDLDGKKLDKDEIDRLEKKERKEVKVIFDEHIKTGQIVFTTFHQSMGYEDFVEGIKPKTKKGKISYKVEDGIFKRLCSKAKENNNKRYVLIIDEINRGNISAIFGELITLIEDDKRLDEDETLEIVLPYSKKKFGVPNNIYIIGTMNTADRSVEALDTALRRRFSFQEMLPKHKLLKPIKFKDYEISLSVILEIVNKRIEVLIDRDHLLGHASLMKVTNLSGLRTVFRDKFLPQLQEYFFGNYEKIAMIIGEDFFIPNNSSKIKFLVNTTNDFDKKIYHIKDLDKMGDDDFLKAIKKMINYKEEAEGE